MKNSLFVVLALPFIASCNMFEFMDSPSGDAQLTSAARACLDEGKFECAREYYNQLSNSAADVKFSELGLTRLAEAQVFSISDLITTLGSGRGGGNTFTLLANMLATRNKDDAATRVLIQEIYASADSIGSSSLRGYIKFVSAMTMFNSILAYAANGDGEVIGNDLVQNADACLNAGLGGCMGTTACDQSSSGLLNNSGSDPTDLATATNWDAEPTLVHLEKASAAADAAMQEMTGSSSGFSGLLGAMNELGNLPGPGQERCKRQVIVQTLFSTSNN